jgi:hypothetical protein
VIPHPGAGGDTDEPHGKKIIIMAETGRFAQVPVLWFSLQSWCGFSLTHKELWRAAPPGDRLMREATIEAFESLFFKVSKVYLSYHL